MWLILEMKLGWCKAETVAMLLQWTVVVEINKHVSNDIANWNSQRKRKIYRTSLAIDESETYCALTNEGGNSRLPLIFPAYCCSI